MASRISDTHAFFQLSRLDALSSNLEAHHSAICGGGESGKKAAAKAVGEAMADGLAQQTWFQFKAILVEMEMLEDRFLSHDLKIPSDTAWQDAAKHAEIAFKEASERRGDIAADLIDHMCTQKKQ